ncbi:hypothetical protein [Nitrospira sp. Kam-Ns4a]
MRVSLFLRRTLLVPSLALAAGLILWLPGESSRAAEQPPAGAAPSAAVEGLGLVASGAVEDTLKACLARIPKDASAGQRMIAEQSCGRDEEDRQAIQAVPGR